MKLVYDGVCSHATPTFVSIYNWMLSLYHYKDNQITRCSRHANWCSAPWIACRWASASCTLKSATLLSRPGRRIDCWISANRKTRLSIRCCAASHNVLWPHCCGCEDTVNSSPCRPTRERWPSISSPLPPIRPIALTFLLKNKLCAPDTNTATILYFTLSQPSFHLCAHVQQCQVQYDLKVPPPLFLVTWPS